MPNSLSTEGDCILKIPAISIMRFSSVEEGWHIHLFLSRFLLSDNFDVLLACQDLLSESTNLGGPILFVDHIESCYELSQPLILFFDTLLDCIKHFLDMLLTNNFETSENKLELKIWGFHLKLINNFSDNLQLFYERNLLLLIVEKHARDMPVFD